MASEQSRTRKPRCLGVSFTCAFKQSEVLRCLGDSGVLFFQEVYGRQSAVLRFLGVLQGPPGQAKRASSRAHLQSEREVDDGARQVWVMRRRRVWANMPAMMQRLDALADAGHLMYSDVRDALEALRLVQQRSIERRV